MLVYYRINGHERYSLQQCSMSPPFDNHGENSLYDIASWHFTKYSFAKTLKQPCVIQDCGWQYPSKEKRYVVMEQRKHEGKWSNYMNARSRFLTLEDAKKVLEDTKNWKNIMSNPNRFLIKEFSNKRYPNLLADNKFTQEQVEKQMCEIFNMEL